jgi:hypothetical protein
MRPLLGGAGSVAFLALRFSMIVLAAASSGCGSDDEGSLPPSAAGGAGGAAGSGGSGGAGGSAPRKLRVLTYNIGNGNGNEPNYPLRLSYQAYEDHVAGLLQALAPDVAFLQEVLPPQFCSAFEETDPARTCFDAANRPPPIRRILGDEYTVVCDARIHVECIGVRKSLGSIRGIAPGDFVLEGAETPALPLPTCNYAAGECSNASCDQEATVSAVTVDTALGPLRIVHAHPNAAGTAGPDGAYDGEPCRYPEIQQIFVGTSETGGVPLASEQQTLVGGDFNFDPDRFASMREVALWREHVGEGKRFSDHNPKDPASGEYYPTRPAGLPVTIDRVVSTWLHGSCTVHGSNNLTSADPMTERLDHAFDWSKVPGGEKFNGRIDHLAVICELSE